ncbi:hypothetical protein FB446DRAFT_753170 [Lentinula raphanica]|nr:hypothetical protein FB446DRAFT_753170 [Lentinula raphanica]
MKFRNPHRRFHNFSSNSTLYMNNRLLSLPTVTIVESLPFFFFFFFLLFLLLLFFFLILIFLLILLIIISHSSQDPNTMTMTHLFFRLHLLHPNPSQVSTLARLLSGTDLLVILSISFRSS